MDALEPQVELINLNCSGVLLMCVYMCMHVWICNFLSATNFVLLLIQAQLHTHMYVGFNFCCRFLSIWNEARNSCFEIMRFIIPFHFCYMHRIYMCIHIYIRATLINAHTHTGITIISIYCTWIYVCMCVCMYMQILKVLTGMYALYTYIYIICMNVCIIHCINLHTYIQYKI